MKNTLHHWLYNKPVLGSLLDCGHPLAGGLQGAWLLNDGGIAVQAFDLSPYHNTLATPSNIGIASDIPGFALKPSTHSGFIQGTTQTVGPPFTICLALKLTTVASDVAFSHDSGANNGYRLNFTTGTPQITFGGVASYNIAGVTALSANQWYLIAAAVDKNVGTVKGAVQKWPADASIVTGSTVVGTMGGTPSKITLAGYSVAANNSLQGSLAFAYWWNRLLSPAELVAMFANPYEMFLSPTTRRWFVAPAPAGQVPWTPWPQLGPVCAQ